MRFSLRLCWNCTIFLSVIQALTMIKYAAIRATDSRVKVRKWRPEGRDQIIVTSCQWLFRLRFEVFSILLIPIHPLRDWSRNNRICVSNRRHNTRSFFIRFLRIKYWPFAFRAVSLRIRYSYLRAESRLTLGHNIKKQYLPRRFPPPSPRFFYPISR